MAVSLTKKKPLPKAPTGYAPGGVTYAKPKPVPAVPKKVALPAGMAPINTGMSDAAREAQLSGGGAWGTYSSPVAQAPTTVQSIGVTQPVKKSFQDYIAEGIPGDWEVQEAEDAFGSRMAGLRSAFGTDIQNALVDLGLPQDEKVQNEFGGYITPETIQKAIANKYSSAAQIAQQEQVQRANTEAALAARGSLRSGSTTNRFTGIAAEGEKGRWQAVQDFLSGAREGLAGLGSAEAGLRGQLATARANAAARLATEYGYSEPAGVEAPVGTTPAPASTAPTAARKPAVPKSMPTAKKATPQSMYGYAMSYTPKKKK